MVDGRVVVRDGRVVGEHEDAPLEAAALSADAAWSRFAERYGACPLP